MAKNLFVIVAFICVYYRNAETIFFKTLEDSCKVDCDGDGTGNPVVTNVPFYCMFIKMDNRCKQSINPEKIKKHVTMTFDMQLRDINETLDELRSRIGGISDSLTEKFIKSDELIKELNGTSGVNLIHLNDIKTKLQEFGTFLNISKTMLKNHNEQLNEQVGLVPNYCVYVEGGKETNTTCII